MAVVKNGILVAWYLEGDQQTPVELNLASLWCVQRQEDCENVLLGIPMAFEQSAVNREFKKKLSISKYHNRMYKYQLSGN